MDEFLHTRVRYDSSSSDSSASETPLVGSADNIFNVKSETGPDFSKLNFYKPSSTLVGDKSQILHFDYYDEDDSSDGNSEISWPSTEIPDVWGANPLSSIPWYDEEKPVTAFKPFQIEYTEDEHAGILTDRILALASTYLNRCPVTNNYVLCKCTLEKRRLTDITIMGYHQYLQYVDLSHNSLETVEALGRLPFLMYLNLSHNKMTEVLPFKAPFNLTYVNYSYNKVVTIRDISDFWSLVYLDLSHNNIETISGLHNLKYLRHLNLEHNDITRLENLNHMNLLTLNLNDNLINSFEEGDNVGLKTLNNLVKFHASNNELTSLKLFQNVNMLQTITMVSNLITDISELYNLNSLLSLTELDLRQNALSSQPNYSDFCIFNLPSLLFLDGNFVDPQSKVHAFAKFRFLGNIFRPMKLTSILTLVNQMNHPIISPFDLKIDEQPPKMVVFVGPPASNKGNFVRQLWSLKKKHIQIAVSHTTRQMLAGEEEGVTYHYVSHAEFISLVNNGEMLTYKNYLGHYFGLCRSELHKVSGTKKILIFHSDLENAIHLKTIGLRPYLMLTLPGDLDVHNKWMSEKYFLQKLDDSVTKVVRGRHFEKEDDSLSGSDFFEYDYNYQPRRDASKESVSSDSGTLLLTQFVDETEMNLLDEAAFSRYQQAHKKLSATSFDSTRDVRNIDVKEKVAFKENAPTVSFGGVLHVDDGSLSGISSGLLEEENHYTSSKLDDDVFVPFEESNADSLYGFHFSIITSRIEYMKYVNENTGYFLNSIFTDEINKSLKKALSLMKDIFLEKIPNEVRYKVTDDPCYETFLAKRLQNFKAQMTKPCYDHQL